MINDTLSHKLNGGKVVKKKKTNSSPLSKKYKKFLNSENIQLSTSKKEKPQLSMNNPDLKINVIKKNEIAKDIEDVKEPCKRKRVKMKDGKLDQVAIEHNKKCEEEMLEMFAKKVEK